MMQAVADLAMRQVSQLLHEGRGQATFASSLRESGGLCRSGYNSALLIT